MTHFQLKHVATTTLRATPLENINSSKNKLGTATAISCKRVCVLRRNVLLLKTLERGQFFLNMLITVTRPDSKYRPGKCFFLQYIQQQKPASHVRRKYRDDLFKFATIAQMTQRSPRMTEVSITVWLSSCTSFFKKNCLMITEQNLGKIHWYIWCGIIVCPRDAEPLSH